MINAIFVEKHPKALQDLKATILDHFPQIAITDCINVSQVSAINMKHQSPCLAFVEASPEILSVFQAFNNCGIETILISNKKEMDFEIVRLGFSGCLLQPIQKEKLVETMQKALDRINLKVEYNRIKDQFDRLLKRNTEKDIIGIPTLKGFHFLKIGEIIRCEGLQSCTRIVTLSQSNIVSGYNLGEFKKLLMPHEFYSPHKSHLINFQMIRSYLKEGTIVMSDQSRVPVSRRKRVEFLSMFKHP